MFTGLICKSKHNAAIAGAITAMTKLDGLIPGLPPVVHFMVAGLLTEAICKGGVPTYEEGMNASLLSVGGGCTVTLASEML